MPVMFRCMPRMELQVCHDHAGLLLLTPRHPAGTRDHRLWMHPLCWTLRLVCEGWHAIPGSIRVCSTRFPRDVWIYFLFCSFSLDNSQLVLYLGEIPINQALDLRVLSVYDVISVLCTCSIAVIPFCAAHECCCWWSCNMLPMFSLLDLSSCRVDNAVDERFSVLCTFEGTSSNNVN